MNNEDLELNMKAQEHDMSDLSVEPLIETCKAIEQCTVGTYQKIADRFCETFLNEDGSMKTGKVGAAVVGAYQKIEDSVVGGYKKIESSIVGSFNKVTDMCVQALFAKEDESVEDAKQRLSCKE